MKFYLIKQVENYIREIYPQEKQENVKKRVWKKTFLADFRAK